MARLLCALLAFAAGAVAAPTSTPSATPKGPTADQIRQAIDELGSPRFAARERASRVLWEAGRAAEPALRDAARGKDEEAANRAKAILEKFEWGLYPDTPAEVARLVEKFRGGDADVRQQVVGELMRLKPSRFDVLRKVIAHEQDQDARKQMYARMAVQARDAVPTLLVANHPEEAHELLEICLSPNNPPSLGDYAAFQYLRNAVPAAVARMEELRKTATPDDARRATEGLVYLHRVRQDWAAARAAADLSKNPELQNDLAWEAGDWKRLAEGTPDGPTADQEDRGAKAAYHRLAGNKAKYDEIIAELRKDLMGVEGDDSAAYTLAYALLLNGQGAEAIEVLKGRHKRGSDLVFDLLCARLQFREAFAYYDAAMKELDADPQAEFERRELALRRGKVLAALGDKDGATQVFRGLLTQALTDKRDRPAIDVVKAVARAGMRDLAAECAARCLEDFRKQGREDEAAEVLLPVFEDKTLMVAIWWRAVVSADQKDADPAARMARVLEFVDGKADRKKADRLAELIQKLRHPKPEKGTSTPNDPPGPAALPAAHADYATAEGYRAVGAADKAEEFYKKAANVKPADVDTGPFVLLDLPDLEDQGVVPTHYRFLIGYADFLAGQKRWKEAAALYQKTWEAAPGQPLPLFLWGHALKQAGNDKEGSRLTDLAHWVPLGNEVLRARFGEDLAKRGFDADGRKEMELVLATGWFRTYAVGNVYLRMARLKARRGDFATAAKFYEKDVVSLFRTSAFFVDAKAYLTVPELARTYRARALLAAGKVEEALAEARAGLAVVPANIELALGFVPDLDKAGRKKEADEIYGKVKGAYVAALQDYGTSADLRNGLAWTMANCSRDLDEALTHATKAVELAPKTAGYIDTLAEVHFRKKDRAKALELMKRCAELDPTNPYFRKQLVRFEKKPFDSPLPDEETGDDD